MLQVPLLFNHKVIIVPLWVKSVIFEQITVRQDIRDPIDKLSPHFDHLNSRSLSSSVIDLSWFVSQACELKKFKCEIRVSFVLMGEAI